MDEPRTSKWVVVATGGLLVILLVGGGLFALRDQLMTQARDIAAKEVAEREKLASRLGALESKLDTVSSAAPDAAMGEQLNASNTKLDDLAKRLEALEKASAEPKPEPLAVAVPVAVPAPVTAAPAADAKIDSGALLTAAIISGKPYDAELIAWQKDHPKALETALALQAFAEHGMPSEQELVEELRAALDAIPAGEPEAPGSIVHKINTHLSGLVSIKKASTDPYVNLRKHALSESYTALLGEVDQLPEEQRKPFASWRDTARARAKAVAALPDVAGVAR